MSLKQNHIDKLQVKALNALAVDMLFNPYKYIIHDMPEICTICHNEMNIFPRGDIDHDGHPMFDPVREIKLDCNHSFHKHCIKEWFKKQNNCPICRTKGVSDGSWDIRGLRSTNWWKGLDYSSGKLYQLDLHPNHKAIVINKLLKAINLIFLWDQAEYYTTQMNVDKLHNALNDFLKSSYDDDDDALKKIPSHWIKRDDGEEFIHWEEIIEYWRDIIPYIIQNLRYIQYKSNSGQIINVPQSEENRKKFNYSKQKLYNIEGVPFPITRDDEQKILKRLLKISGGRRNKTRKRKIKKRRRKKTKKRRRKKTKKRHRKKRKKRTKRRR